MDYETEKINLSREIPENTYSFWIEDDVIIPDTKPDILSTLSSSGNVYVYKKEIINNGFKIDGGVQADISYMADNENADVRALHTVIDFSKNIDVEGLNNNGSVKCYFYIKEFDCKVLNGRKISLKVNVELKYFPFINEEMEIIGNIPENLDYQTISDEVSLYTVRGVGKTSVTARDSFSVNEGIVDIISSNIELTNKAYKTSYNKILTKAEANANITYLDENNEIKSTVVKIPIMGFIDLNGISEDDKCDIHYEMRNLLVKVGDENKSCNIELEYSIFCMAYESRIMNLIQDLYSPDKDVILENENRLIINKKINMIENIDIQENVVIPEFNCRKIVSYKIIPTLESRDFYDNTLDYKGYLTIKILYKSDNERTQYKEQTLSFSKNLNIELDKDDKLYTVVTVSSSDILLNSDGSISIKVSLILNIDVDKRKNVNLLKQITEQSLEERNVCSLTIYYVKKGDTLWNIAKKFKSTVEEIKNANNLEDDKLDVGMQLFIPKYVRCKV